MAWVVLPEKDSPAAQRLIGSTVKVRGVAGSHMDAANRRVGAQLFVNSLEDIEVQELAAPVFPSSRAGHPLQTVQQIHNLGNAEAAKSHPWNCRVWLLTQIQNGACSLFAIEPAQSISTCMATTKRIRQARQCSWTESRARGTCRQMWRSRQSRLSATGLFPPRSQEVSKSLTRVGQTVVGWSQKACCALAIRPGRASVSASSMERTWHGSSCPP